MIAWGLVPARGGSKSIRRKNLVELAGRPMLDYGVRAGQASSVLERIVCSTDDNEIAARATHLGIEVDRRPPELATDEAKVDDVAREWLARTIERDGRRPDIVVLLQPTSPFVQPRHVSDLVAFFTKRPQAGSVHNAYPVPHNLHIWNHRGVADDGAVSFPFEAERSTARNKQEKPKLYAFGNLIAATTDALLSGAGFYAKPVYALPVPPAFAFDLDRQEDMALAEAVLAAGLVNLDHLKQSS